MHLVGGNILVSKYVKYSQGDKYFLLYKHQWNTKWAYMQKHDTFICEKITVAMVTDKNRTFPCFTLKKILKWNDLYFVGVDIINRILHGFLETPNFFSPRGHVITTIGKISAQPHTTLCIQFLSRENNDKNNTFPLGKQICFTIVWGCTETLPFYLLTKFEVPTVRRNTVS